MPLCVTVLLLYFTSPHLFSVVNCGDPGHPKNGLTKARGGFTYGNDVTFSCLANYVLQGSLLATCESDGRWSKRLPTCLGEMLCISSQTFNHLKFTRAHRTYKHWITSSRINTLNFSKRSRCSLAKKCFILTSFRTQDFDTSRRSHSF